MQRSEILIILLLFFLSRQELSALGGNNYNVTTTQDSLRDSQILYNGRQWINNYYLVKGDQFLFSNEYLTGSVSIGGKTFSNIDLKYDLFKDELLIPMDQAGILQLNKEMVDSFTLSFLNKTYRFEKITGDSLTGLKTYANILYKGKSTLYVIYSKKIEKLAVEGKYDNFYQVNKICLVNRGTTHYLTRKNELIKILYEERNLIKNFIRKNKLSISIKDPGSLVPVIRYYDTLTR